MKVLVAPSCFKESVSAEQAAAAIGRGVRRALPSAELRELPFVDGGEGFARTLTRLAGGRMVEVEVPGPLGRPARASFGWIDESVHRVAVVEAAAAVGLRWVPRGERDLRRATSAGAGALLGAALDGGAHRVLVGVGDTAVNDGGAGLARALGARLLDARGMDLPCDAISLARLARIDTRHLHPRLGSCRIEVACNPKAQLLGPSGATRVYGPHKGADPTTVEALEVALTRYAQVLSDATGLDVASVPGAGAGGGMAATLHALCGATLRPRYDVLLEHLPLARDLAWADLVITGEGRLDETTLHGKVPAEIVRRARARNLPVIALVGQVGTGARALLDAGLDAYVACTSDAIPLEEALRCTEELLEACADRTLRVFAQGRALAESL